MKTFDVWSVDPLVKVFRDDSPTGNREISVESARNEYESGQLAIRSNSDLRGVGVKAYPLVHELEKTELEVQTNFVGYVPVVQNTQDTPKEELLREAPHEFPDYLMEEGELDIQAHETQPVWLTIYVPEDALPGTYTGSIGVLASGEEFFLPVRLKVHPATVPTRRSLLLTNWFNASNVAKFHNVEPWSEQHWKLIEAYAEDMASHRQNVIRTPLLSLVRIYQSTGRSLRFDFSLLDHWVKLFQEAGVVGYIEGGHLAGRRRGWKEGFDLHGYQILKPDDTVAESKPAVDMASEGCRSFLSQFLPALERHLEERGLINLYFQHLADEPIPENAESYRILADLVKQYAPKLQRIDANMTTDLVGCLDVWVPLLHEFDENEEFYAERKAAGEAVWFYTCLAPRGKYPNRFIDFSLLKVRLLHWINFKYNLGGYLHWGYNYWTENPFKITQPKWGESRLLPPGDMCIVYPGTRGPINSIRFEALRDGVEDYELLKTLNKKDEDTAKEICNSIIRSPTDYEKDPRAFRKARHRLLAELSE